MNTPTFLTFLVVSFWLIIIPGPNVLVIVSTSITHGRKRGLQTVAGTSLAMLLQLVIVSIGTGWFVRLVADGLYYLKWLGIIYLLYLGLAQLKKALTISGAMTGASAAASFSRGFIVSLTNPKTLLFFSAFLPQFVSATENYHLQIVLLSCSFLMLAILLDSCYALLSSRLARFTQNAYLTRFQHGFSGLLFLCAGAWLASTKR